MVVIVPEGLTVNGGTTAWMLAYTSILAGASDINDLSGGRPQVAPASHRRHRYILWGL